ncbi:hypothetical protein MRX96_003908 [Rhipicephalus microplus]
MLADISSARPGRHIGRRSQYRLAARFLIDVAGKTIVLYKRCSTPAGESVPIGASCRTVYCCGGFLLRSCARRPFLAASVKVRSSSSADRPRVIPSDDVSFFSPLTLLLRIALLGRRRRQDVRLPRRSQRDRFDHVTRQPVSGDVEALLFSEERLADPRTCAAREKRGSFA